MQTNFPLVLSGLPYGHGASKLGKGGNKTPSIVTPIFTFYTIFPIVRYQNEKNRLAKSRFSLYL